MLLLCSFRVTLVALVFLLDQNVKSSFPTESK